MALKVCAIAAMDEGRVIGFNNKLPWKLSEDMQRFAALTTGHTVLMGRKTYESLPLKFRPLPNRRNVVFSRKAAALGGQNSPEIWTSLEDFFKAFKSGKLSLPSDTVWIIGGAEIYRESMPWWDELYLTRVHSKHDGDAFFPPFEDRFVLESSEDKGAFSFERFVRKSEF